MNKVRKDRPFFTIVFLLALFLRLGLALVNREANDDHLEEVRLIMKTQRLPDMLDCRECFHPKMFYGSAAVLLEVFAINDPEAQIVFLQLLNVLSGAITLLVVWKFISEYPSENEMPKLLAFALVALNPKIIAVNAQISNDTFVTMFSTLALYFAYRFFKEPGPVLFGLVTLFNVLAVATKAPGWTAFAAITLSFLVVAWTQRSKKALLYAPLLLVSVLALTALNPLSQVVTNYQKFGSPIIFNGERLPLPKLVTPTVNYKNYYFRPGIVSIQDGFLTFKMIYLLKYPLITNEQYGYPPQRTSFWTMLYADSNSLHFQNWPVSWQTQTDENFNISRGIFILALVPAFMLIAGFVLELIRFLRNMRERSQPEVPALFLLTCGGYIAFLMLTNLLYRDFALIKLNYILPGLLAFTWLFMRGAEMFLKHWLVVGALIVLLGFYVVDVTSMFFQLYRLVAL